MSKEDWDGLSSIKDLTQKNAQYSVITFANMLQLKDERSVATASLHSKEDLIDEMKNESSDIQRGREPYIGVFAARFCSQHLQHLFKAYKATPDNVLTTPYTLMMCSMLERNHFASFARSSEGREMLQIQVRRIATHDVANRLWQLLHVIELLNFLIVHAYHGNDQVDPVIDERYKPGLRTRCEEWRSWISKFLASMDPRNARNIGMLTETIEFLDGVRSPGDMLSYVEPAGKKIPLATCGHVKSECWRTGVVPTKACSGCKCIRYCGPEHQKSDWRRHKVACVAPPWVQ